MPPFIPKKRLASTPPPSQKPTPVKKARLTDVLDAEARNGPGLGRPQPFSLGSDDSDSSLSDVDSDQFEDVPPRAQMPSPAGVYKEDEDSDDDDQFEDVELHHDGHQDPASEAAPKAPFQLKFDVGDDMIDYGTTTKTKQGPSKREKEVRIRTHQMHVRYLLWHNAIRNRWICDQEVQQTLIAQLPAQIKKEVDKWRRASGLPEQDEKPRPTPQEVKKSRKRKPVNPREERDWGRPSEKLDTGKADMSRGDPLISLLKILAAYWKKRFAISAPGLRKRGYGTKLQLRRDVESYRNDKHDHEKHGERIRNLKEFREVAKRGEGSRDVGAQLFTALLRGLGIESRLIASLQPAGYGWTKFEQMMPRKATSNVVKATTADSPENDTDEPPQKSKSKPKATPSKVKKKQPTRKGKGAKDTPIDLDSEDQSSDTPDDESVVDITPTLPKQRAAKYDRDLVSPIYWTEAISPITNQVIPVDPLILEKPVATTPELLANFEPRGAKAENARLVIAYVVGYSDDGTAKDVTVRYIRKHIWPGKTKPFRYPIEKVPVYDRTGRIKRYEDFDWFKYIMSGYVRSDGMRTAVDDIEDSTDLVPQLPEKKDIDTSVDTLQSLKASADFVLERFLRREEALRPGAKVDRTFISGKGDNLKSEPVYRRSDVERCLTAESWHKEGRHPKPGEKPMKMVPVRAVTLTRKREAEEHERLTGMKQLQGLYSWDQTKYIIPPPIEDGVIPKNSYGNIDCFVPSMVPKGAVHIPLRSTVRICKRLEIDYAEAVVGFEFGNKRAVPVINGVVVAKEHEKDVRKAWKEWNDEQQKKEAVKKEKLILDLWRKFVMGLRIRERVGEMYGEELGEGSGLPVQLKKGVTSDQPIDVDEDEAAPIAGPSEAGGFEPEDDSTMGGGFLLSDEEDRLEQEDLVIEHHPYEPTRNISAANSKGKEKEKDPDATVAAAQYPTPVSLPPTKKGNAAATDKGKSKLQQRRQEEGTESSSELSDISDPSDEGYKSNGSDDDIKKTAEIDRANDESSATESDVDADTDSNSESSSDASADSASDSDSTSNDENDVKDEDEEDYLPVSASRRRRTRPTAAHTSTNTPTKPRQSREAQSTRSTRSTDATPKSNVRVIIDAPKTSNSNLASSTNPKSASTPTRSTRRSQAHPTATGVTSPYFKSEKKSRRKQ